MKTYAILVESPDNAVIMATNINQTELDDTLQKVAVDLIVSEAQTHSHLFTETDAKGNVCIKYKYPKVRKGWVYNDTVLREKLLYTVKCIPIVEELN